MCYIKIKSWDVKPSLLPGRWTVVGALVEVMACPAAAAERSPRLEDNLINTVVLHYD